ncbi:peptidase M28 [Parapedobacter defluvii]|uniref:Peptidase M28 n=1 Tax=Parapedobacter defluvii TaxID=2045106 RepID=A0ABQ1LW59_9SPHI|nr:M20/M25/M40 family metallo-hydrolase [Parapedobacter defluvii]GGC30878.1 peptidase M28 [Parapedobacter defluvii]
MNVFNHCIWIAVLLLTGCTVRQSSDRIVDTAEVKRILNTLAADDMEGRAAFSSGIERAADFIATEFDKIGLQPYAQDDYRQTFHVSRIRPTTWEVAFDGADIPLEHVIISSNSPGINWNDEPGVSLIQIQAGDDFAQRFRDASVGGKDAIVVVDTSFASLFERYRGFLMQGRINQPGQPSQPTPSVVYVLANQAPKSFRVSFTNQIEELPLFNVVGMLPGKSKPGEYVIFSAHYDHIGILQPVGQDSIANGADDDASGVSAVISLANYYKRLNNNERSLLFVAFTAEEIGLVGSNYFSKQLHADSVVAMINIEMIGKDSKFGPNSLYVTGYNQSNLAQIMQQNVQNTAFTFHPDPYPTQNLFYRSDNASLAALGVPAHTFATVQIDKDGYYHTVDDEIETLDIDNIVSSIKAIAIGAKSIVAGKDTPTRVPKLKR